MHRAKQSAGYSIMAGLSLFFAIQFLSGCDETFPRNKSYAAVPLSSIKQGKALAETYCGSCHLLPDPSLLNAASWARGVLPNMGPRLGIFQHDSTAYPSANDDMNLEAGFYPDEPILTSAEWQCIIDYYTAASPDTLPAQQRAAAIQMSLPLFEVQNPLLSYTNAMVSFVKINERDSARKLLVSDARQRKTFLLNKNLEATDSVTTSGPVVDMELFQNTMLACNMGVMAPNNGAYGKGAYMRKNEHGAWSEDAAGLFQNLRRPVQIAAADFNNDSRTDFLICEFGYLTGSLCWMENTGGQTYRRHVLRPLPGAAKAWLQDYNRDGRMDIWVLFAQGDEGIFLYTNKGGGKFSAQQVLRFPPVYGSSYFELADFNADGHPDIVYTCGDNADYSTVLKPYHGVYIFVNDGSNNFRQQAFFPIHGCYKAMARDFDKDGDLDLAAISYFADYATQPEESFVYLENTGNFGFQPHSTEAAKWGRWLTMDAGDVDGDGWTDIVLGNFCIGPVDPKLAYDWRKAPPFILLKNKGKK